MIRVDLKLKKKYPAGTIADGMSATRFRACSPKSQPK